MGLFMGSFLGLGIGVVVVVQPFPTRRFLPAPGGSFLPEKSTSISMQTFEFVNERVHIGDNKYPRRTFDPMCATPAPRRWWRLTTTAHPSQWIVVGLWESPGRGVPLPVRLPWCSPEVKNLRALPLLFRKCPPQTNYQPNSSSDRRT